MLCIECGEQLGMVSDEYNFRDRFVGEIVVPKLQRLRCTGCGDELLDNNAMLACDAAVEKRRAELLEEKPAKSFVSAREAADRLGISRQALSLNRRIKRGYVYSILKDGRKWYYAPSIERFHNTGDGRLHI